MLSDRGLVLGPAMYRTCELHPLVTDYAGEESLQAAFADALTRIAAPEYIA
ncbi:hypothetical protein [Streptomyces sp. NPDC002402]